MGITVGEIRLNIKNRAAIHKIRAGYIQNRPKSRVKPYLSRRTQDNPMALGRNGERVAKTPILVFPPSRGGLTVGDQFRLTASENCQSSHMWEYPSNPRNASGSEIPVQTQWWKSRNQQARFAVESQILRKNHCEYVRLSASASL